MRAPNTAKWQGYYFLHKQYKCVKPLPAFGLVLAINVSIGIWDQPTMNGELEG